MAGRKVVARYIDLDTAVARLTHLEVTRPTATMTAAKRVLADMFPADVVPVVHGQWTEADWVEMESGGRELIRTPNAALRCSNCRCCFRKELLWRSNYCPHCGAKMDRGGDCDG